MLKEEGEGEGVLPIVPSIDEFKRRFNIFTGGMLEGIFFSLLLSPSLFSLLCCLTVCTGLDWSNLFCAGGSVLACLLKYVPSNQLSSFTFSFFFTFNSYLSFVFISFLTIYSVTFPQPVKLMMRSQITF